MSSKSNSASGGIGFFGLLGIVFIVLKLTHFIDWPWVWVLAPLWAPLVIFLVVVAVVILFSFIFIVSRRRI